MAKYEYSKYKITIDPESKKVQGLCVGDVVRRQYRDGATLIYSLMLVLEVSADSINSKESYYFIGALLEGSEPRSGELLDFVRITSLIDKSRGGALYLTASDSESPYLDVIDGLGFEHSLLQISELQRTTTNFRYPINGTVSNPEMLIVAFRVRASNETNATLSIGYSDEIDGIDTLQLTTQWQYKLSTIIINYPGQYQRELIITSDNTEWIEIEQLNVVRLSDIATFSKASKARIGKITGIVDPIFGKLEGYGAYFQNLYATRNINIAGTLTAGDENGFASTFYVGKIHKNIIINSLECAFTDAIEVVTPTPVGIGKVRQITNDTSLTVQTSSWREERITQSYTFSIWIKGGADSVIIYQDEHNVGAITTYGEDWNRYSVTFKIKSSETSQMSIRLQGATSDTLITAPQLEAGEYPSLYQPTDDTLTETEDYGAWFSKGGIGGTIQNPLLKLNVDGSISSTDGSFVINRDGTGHFSDGRFKWTKDSIELQDVTLKWVDFDDESKDVIVDAAATTTVQLFSTQGNTFTNGVIETTLTARVYKADRDITDTIEEGYFSWRRVSSDSSGDTIWNELHEGVGSTITITAEDVFRRALFECFISNNQI